MPEIANSKVDCEEITDEDSVDFFGSGEGFTEKSINVAVGHGMFAVGLH